MPDSENFDIYAYGMYCCRFSVLLNAHFVSSMIAWSIKLIGKFILKDKYSLFPFISGVLL